jgi:hypothetical protein
MAELTAAKAATEACTPEAQATCYEPSAKAECCDLSHGGDCGCSAGDGVDSPDIRERNVIDVPLETR